MTQMLFDLSLYGPGLGDLLQAAIDHGLIPRSPPDKDLSLDLKTVKSRADWAAFSLAASKSEFSAEWKDGTYLHVTKETILRIHREHPRDLAAITKWLAQLPFTLASFGAIYPDWSDLGYLAPSFGDLHEGLGWACAFRGAGHDRLASSRWLDHAGPWRVVRPTKDLSLVQFHDLNADSQTALAQARPGHQRMGISNEGGFLQAPFSYLSEVKGRWQPDDHSLTVVVHGRDVPPREMLDYSAARATQALGKDKVLERIRFVFMEEAVARAHLHELWLHGLECWTIVQGSEKRLDEGYKPPPSLPVWAEKL